MKPVYSLLFIVSALIGVHCGKENPVQKSHYTLNAFSDSAIRFLKDRLSKEDLSTLDTTDINVIKYKEQEVAVRIFQKGASGKRFILLHKYGVNYDGNWVDVKGISRNSTRKFDGTIILSTLDSKYLNELTIKNSIVISDSNQARVTNSMIDNARNYRTGISTPGNPHVLDEVVVVGYLDGGDYYSMYWLFNQASAFDSWYMPDSYIGVGGSVSNSYAVTAPKYISPTHPISDINKELECFTNDKNSTYTVSVNVNQPVPNSRDLINVGSDFIGGHSYLTMEQQFANGNTIVRNVGFYPATGAKPGKEIDGSVFGDDSNTPYSVSLKLSVTAKEFESLQIMVSYQQNFPYQLQNFNCTHSVFYAFEAINIHMPATIGKNALFSGYNPGDLGQDIREMNLNDFSTENGGRKVVRTVSNSNSLKPPARKGSC